MRGVILAAGRGSRLFELTDDKPKCLVELAGRPLLHWVVQAMRQANIDKILVVRGYLGEMITGDFDVCENFKWHQTNMVTSLLCAQEWLKQEPCIVSYSDIVYSSRAISKLMASTTPLSLLYDENWMELWEKRFSDPLSDAESFSVDKQGFVSDVGRKGVALDEVHGQYMGLIKFTPDACDWVEELFLEQADLIEEIDMTSLLSNLIQNGRNVKGIPWSEPWCEIDSAHDLSVAESLVASGQLKF